MKFMATAVAVLVLAFAGNACADQDAREEAEALMEAVDMRVAVDQTVNIMLDAQIKQRPDLAPYRNVIKTFFDKYMSYDVLKPDIISLYEADFTAKELKEVRKFYQTSAGRKVIQKMPLLLRQSADIGSKRAQEHIADLQKMIQEETDRLKSAQQH